jgi:hypothetical protein
VSLFAKYKSQKIIGKENNVIRNIINSLIQLTEESFTFVVPVKVDTNLLPDSRSLAEILS